MVIVVVEPADLVEVKMTGADRARMTTPTAPGYPWDDISFPKNDLTPWSPEVKRGPQPKQRPSGGNLETNNNGLQSATGSGAGRQIARISTLSWTSCVLLLLLATISHRLCWCCCRVVVIINHHLFCCAWWRHLYAQWWRHRYLW